MPALEEFRKIMFDYVEAYFKMLWALRNLENNIPSLKTEEEKIKAYKEYFRVHEQLKKLEPEIKRLLEVL